MVQFLGFCFHSFKDILGLLSAQHENDAFHGVVILLKTEFTQARSVSDGHVSHVPDSDGHAFVGADHDVSNVLGVSYQPDAANVIELPTLRIEAAPGIRIVSRQRCCHLRDGQVIPIDARRVEQHLILHHRSAEARVVRHAVNRTIGALNHPVFNGFQLLRSAIGTLQHIAIDQAAWTEERCEGRSHSCGQRGLSEPFEHDLPRKVIVGVFFEGEDYIGQPIE